MPGHSRASKELIDFISFIIVLLSLGSLDIYRDFHIANQVN